MWLDQRGRGEILVVGGVVSVVLLTIIVSASVLFANYNNRITSGGTRASSRTSAATLSSAAPATSPGRFSIRFCSCGAGRLVSGSGGGGLSRGLGRTVGLAGAASRRGIRSVSIRPACIVLLSCLGSADHSLYFLMCIGNSSICIRTSGERTGVGLSATNCSVCGDGCGGSRLRRLVGWSRYGIT